MKMLIVFVRPPFYSLLGALKPVYPIGIGYLSSVLKERDYEVRLIDGETQISPGLSRDKGLMDKVRARLMPSQYLHGKFLNLSSIMKDPYHRVWSAIVSQIEKVNPDAVGLTCVSQSVTAVKILAYLIKKRIGDIPIVVGGVHPSAQPKQLMRDIEEIDYLVRGEGERTIVELCDMLSSGQKDLSLKEIKGIAFRQNGNILLTPPRGLIEDLDTLPFPNRNLGQRNNYYSSDTILTSRGCPFSCNFCASNVIWIRRVRYRTIDNVIGEIDSLVQNHGSKRIRIDDDTFTLSKKRVLEFCHKIRDAGYDKKLTFSLGSRVDTLDEEMVENLASIGVDTISFGIESGSSKILKEINKQITPQQVKECISVVTKYKIRCLCYFMIGHPNETIEDVKQSMHLFRQISNFYVDSELNITSPYPGTKLWEDATNKRFRLEADEYYKLFHQGIMTVNLSQMTDQELLQYYKKFCRIVSLHGIGCKIFTVSNMIWSGKIRQAINLIRN